MSAFAFDIFISYAHIDNQPLGEGQKGWIARLHERLEIRLAQLLGERPQIWRDPRLQGNEIFDESIVQQLDRVAILVSVVSPRYVKSEWCTKELHRFLEAAEQTGGIRIGNKTRLFKVVKTPISEDEHPPELQPFLGYSFFEIDAEKGRPIEFDQTLNPEIKQQYWARFNDLAYDIRDMLEMLGTQGDGAAVPPSRATVYLAETTYDLHDERDDILRELKQSGYTVLPDRSLPLYGPKLEGMVRDYLTQCDLSVHLVGANYGIVPEAAEHSVIQLQNRLAAEQSATTGLTRLIWLPPDLDARDERQQSFVQRLHNDAAAQRGADLLETTIEDLKTEIVDKLTPKEEPEPVPGITQADDQPPLVYLLCDQRDEEAVDVLDEYLYNQGIEVKLPLFADDEGQVREYHQEMLKLCDAVLIYYGEADASWVEVKLMDLRKAPGYGRAVPMCATAVYVAGLENRHKTRFRTRDVNEVIKHFDAFAPDVLAAFLGRLKAGSGGTAS